LQAEKLILLTDVPGVLDGRGELINTLNIDIAEEMIQSGVIAGGMYPKVKCCLKALKGGVKKTHIIDGRLKHAVMLEMFTDRGIGTEIV
jgi:acetylglutamate kinase